MPCLDDNTVAALMEGTLSAEANAQVQQHLESCASCRQLVAAMLRGDRASTDSASGDTLPSTSPHPAPRPSGTRLGRYVVLDPIGVGGMGVVYSAYDPVLERKLALKLVRPEASSQALAEVRERLLREGKSIAQLSHPNIVAVFDMGTSDDQVFIAMELVDGGSLRQWLKAQPRPWREVLARFLAAGQGLAAAHRAGLVHRDFKPENVLVGRDGRVRVTDFGLAAVSGAGASAPGAPQALEPRLTQDGALLGTPAYMAPEQRAGAGADALSDQFSFCVALWEALYGVRPYDVLRPPAQWVLREPPADSPVPPWVRRALQKGLSLQPAQRFEGLDGLLLALEADPARARRLRLQVGGAALAVLAAVSGSMWWAANRGDRLCRGAEARVALAWSNEVASQVAAAFVATGLDGAADDWARARGGLERYWRGWAAMHTEACQATRVRGEQSDQVLGLRMACLDRRYDEARALVGVFSKADREVVARSPEAVDALVALEGCADNAALLAQGRAADDPRVRALLGEGKARFDTGGYREAVGQASQALQLAVELKDTPAQAEALLLRGRLEEHLGDLKAAEQTLLDALSTAQAGKNDVVTAEAATVLALVLGSRQARYAEAHAWLKLAEGSIGRIGGNPALQARLLQAQGLVHYAEGHLTEAIEAHQRAVGLLEQLEPDSLDLAEALNGLGSALRGGRRSTEALAAFERALGILLERVGPDSDLVAGTRNGMANALMLDGRFDEALTLYQQSLATFARRLGPTHFRTVTSDNNVGVVLAEQGRYAEALPWFQKVLDARVKTLAPTDAKTADAHSNLGMLLVELGRYDEAMAHFDQARGILQGYPLDHFSQAESLLGVAKVHLAQRHGQQAIEPLQRVLTLCEKKEGFRFDYTRARADFLMGRAELEARQRPTEGRALALAAREALVGFGPERFRRDLAEIDAWLAAHPSGPAPRR